jgi:hypothetical protein
MRSCCFKRAGQLMGAALVSGLLWTATEIPASAQNVSADHIKKCLLFIASEPPVCLHPARHQTPEPTAEPPGCTQLE